MGRTRHKRACPREPAAAAGSAAIQRAIVENTDPRAAHPSYRRWAFRHMLAFDERRTATRRLIRLMAKVKDDNRRDDPKYQIQNNNPIEIRRASCRDRE